MRAAAWVDELADRFLWVAKITILISLCIVAYYAADRKAPLRVLAVAPAEARAGEEVVLRAVVWRDLSRPCSAEMSRYVLDADNVRYDIGAHMESRSPGGLNLSFIVPAEAHPGPAELVSALSYTCNKVHNLWPIELTTRMPFSVLP